MAQPNKTVKYDSNKQLLRISKTAEQQPKDTFAEVFPSCCLKNAGVCSASCPLYVPGGCSESGCSHSFHSFEAE